MNRNELISRYQQLLMQLGELQVMDWDNEAKRQAIKAQLVELKAEDNKIRAVEDALSAEAVEKQKAKKVKIPKEIANGNGAGKKEAVVASRTSRPQNQA